MRIATWAMNSGRAPVRGKNQREMIGLTIDMARSISGCHPDLVVFPEIFLKSGGDTDNPEWAEITGEMLSAFSSLAVEMKSMFIVSAYEKHEREPDKKYNTAYLIASDGRLAGKYRKRHTVYEESVINGVVPGGEPPIFDTPLGRIGILTCFDIGWRKTWEKLADKGARLILWLAAYDGGNLLQTYAAYNMCWVASSVRTDHAKIVDPTGRTVAESSCWNGLCMDDINLRTELFHIDRQFQKIDQIRRELGDRVTIKSYSEENVFTIAPNDPGLSISDVCRDFGLMTYRDYHAEAEKLQDDWRERYRV